ncbi:SPRY domain-containing SOCS box protein 3 isoform X2 [Bradysia coprophila]|nr:SPRY domain-containing SOCS box protein 3 isoform X2 [Bradysia coprophila]XP_037041705.1 SPRY domain-containing SOCS box protein 3 isoform X2 [Bradysia coprophila]
MSRNLQLARHIYKKSQNNRSPAFCKCSQAVAELCECGEKDSRSLDWLWHIESDEVSNLLIYGQTVVFHPTFSQGTAAVKGSTSLDKNMIHHWEIKILSDMTGTDLMVGVGTDKVDLSSCKYKYTSLLGLCNQSWGYSYRGLAQHNGRLKYYGKRYSSLCIVGVYLDLRHRCIEFYLNRRPQGTAYRQIKLDDDAEVYPMVCSTSAKSIVRLINATSFAENLQYLCMKVISKDRNSIEFVKSAPGLRHLCNDYWFLLSKEQYQYSERDNGKALLEDEALLCCSDDQEHSNSTDESITDEMDIYNGVDYIKHRKRNRTSSCSSDDDNDVDMEFFCDHY